MGVCCSKETDPGSSNQTDSPVNNVDGGFVDIRVDSRIRYDEQIIEVMKKEFKQLPEMFLLNNLLMTVQFFENYTRDVQKLSQSSSNKMEKELNKTLLQNETMECICPDTIFDVVNGNLKYRPIHGRRKFDSQFLIARRLFVVTDAIEVINSMEVPQYTSIDKPAYQVRIEESTRKGFVRLKQIDNSRVVDIYSPPSEEPGPSVSSDGDSNSDYTSITYLKTPKPLETMDNPERRDTLPASCFTSKKIKKPHFELQDLQDEFIAGGDITEEDFFETVIYVDAKGFMNYFKNALFPNSLGRSLGFDQHEIDLAKSIPGKVFCNLTDDEDNPIPCEIIPSVAIQWPSEQTFEFIMREDRPTITDTSTGIRYKWPTDEMIKEMRTFNCVVIPKGYWKKKGTYSDATIEWEIGFPKAERYIEARMSHAQIRCFLFLLVLHKHYIEPVTQQHGLLVDHIRCHMYWECEANYKDWPEHRLGTKILKVMENLNSRLSKCELPDFFIKQKNHFRNIPKKYLEFAQKTFHNISQAPTVYFLKALRCVRYSSGRFYSPFEYKEFYRIITHAQGSKLINPHLTERPINFYKQTYQDPEMQWNHLQELKRRKQYLEKMKQKNAEENLDTVSVDSIDTEWTCPKQFEIFKSKAILTQYITSFINIAKESFTFGGSTIQQPLFYLKQALYLTRILESISSAFIPEAREYKTQIHEEETRWKRSAVMKTSDVPPETPVRNSLQFDFQMTQQLKNNMLNLNNLHKSYSKAGVSSIPSFKSGIRNSTSVMLSTPVKRVNSDVSKPKSGRKTVAFVQPN